MIAFKTFTCLFKPQGNSKMATMEDVLWSINRAIVHRQVVKICALLLSDLMVFWALPKPNALPEWKFQFSRSVVSDSLWPHESQHARPPCPSPTPGVHSHSRPSSQWCHPAISSSVVLFSPCPQSLPASESFPMSQLFAWGGQSIGVSALTSFLPKKSRADLLAVQGTLKSLLQHYSS